MTARDPRGRPILDAPLRDFVVALIRARPDAFGHLDPERILFVAGAARRAARASVRPFAVARHGSRRPRVEVDGHHIHYEICLRPRFFLDSTSDERARILAHELWHVSPRFDGTLAEDRRHGRRPEATLEADLDAALEGFDPRATALWPLIAEPGERRMRAWRERPPSVLPPAGGVRAAYSGADLYDAVVIVQA